jgi:hypothetical protein
LKRIGLGVGRLTGGKEAAEAVKTYANPETRPSYEQILENAPEGLGQGAGTVVAGESLPKIGRAVKEGLNVPEVKKAVTAPVRAVSRGLGKIAPAVPTALGMAAGEAAGHPYYGAIAGRVLLPKESIEGLAEKGKTVGLPKVEAAHQQLEERAKKSE